MLGSDGFAEFFEQDYLRVVLILMRFGASRADAEDCAQEAMTQACRNWTSIQVPHSWVRTVAIRTYLKAVRAHKRTCPLGDVSAETYALDPDLAMFREEQQQVLALLRRLPPKQRLVLALYYDGLRPEEIAEATGKSAATVRSLLRYSRRRLQEVMQSEGNARISTGNP